MLMNTSESYGLIARMLHWVVAALVIAMLLGGVLVAALPSGAIKAFFVSVHKSTGTVVLLLMIIRLIWRACNPQPRDPDDLPALNYIARVLHIWLYVLAFLQPLSGILMSQAYGYPVSVFGLFQWPPMIWQSPALGAGFAKIHAATAVVLLLAIAIHAAAALKHHYIDGDRVLLRMLKGE